jgi:putative addiction module killer protein
MIEVRRTAEFSKWLAGLRDMEARARIAVKIERIVQGNLGDARPVGDGVGELRFDFGPGYRVYFVRRGDVLVILLCGGDKDSQQRDIKRAKELAQEIE